MAAYTQANRPLAITTPLGPDALLLVGLRGTEALNELFRFDLDLLAPKGYLVPFDQVLGQPVSVRLGSAYDNPRWFHGIIRRLVRGGRDSEFVRYKAEMVPSFWRLTRRIRSRIFQQVSVPNILKQVLEEFRPDLLLDLNETYHPRDYCVQYNESDYAFACRLMEEAGISWGFDHTAQGHTLFVSDSVRNPIDLPNAPVLLYAPTAGGGRDEPRIFTWEMAQEVRSGQYTVWDHSFELHGQVLRGDIIPPRKLVGKRETPDAVHVGTISHRLKLTANNDLEICEYPGGFAHRFDSVGPGGEDHSGDLPRVYEDAQRTAVLRMEEEVCQSIVIHGSSNIGHLVPGYRFKLIGHIEDIGEYGLTGVEHRARLSGYRSGEKDGFHYRNRFTCLPAELVCRPVRKTPKPVIAGVQTATVVAPPNTEVYTDKYGRVKVQFHWDHEGKYDGNSVCWVRVAQMWAGNRYGAFFWPRPGHEVVVSFEDGDPDKPLITGSVYNAANMPPFELPKRADVAGIKSCSLGGDPLQHFNAVLFHDQRGNEHVQIHSETQEVCTSEATKFSITPGPLVQISGSLPFAISSGSGGGAPAAPSEDSPYFSVAAPLTGSGSGGGWLLDQAGMVSLILLSAGRPQMGEVMNVVLPGDVKVVFGDNMNATLFGSRTTHTLIASESKMVFDPEGMLGEWLTGLPGKFGPTAGLLGALGGMALGLGGGYSELLMGSRSSFNYVGPRLDVHRCPRTTYNSDSFLTDKTLLARAIQGLAVLSGLSATISDIVTKVVTVATEDKAGPPLWLLWPQWGTGWIFGKTFGLLGVLEGVNAEVKAAETKAKETQRILEHIKSLVATVGKAENALLNTQSLLAESKRTAELGLQSVANSVALLKKEGAKGVSARDDTNVEGPYSIRATDMSLISKSKTTLLGPGTERTTIHIAAEGSGTNGTVKIGGSGAVILGCGNYATTVSLAEGIMGQASIGVLNTVNGAIQLLQKSVLGNVEVLLDNRKGPSLTISADLLGVGSSIALDAKSISLKCGLSSLTMNALSGIELAVGPKSKVRVTPDGVAIDSLIVDMKALLQLAQQALQMQEQVGSLKRESDVIKFMGS